MNAALLRCLTLAAAMLALPGKAQPTASVPPPAGPLPSASPTLFVEASTESLPRGWPLVLSVGLLHPRAVEPEEQAHAAGNISIEAASGSWDQFLSIEVFHRVNRVKKPVRWPLRRMENPPRNVTLTSTEPRAVLHYVLSPEETAQLASGQYYVIAKLDATRGTSGRSWKGTLSSARVLMLTEPASGLAPDEGCRFTLTSHEYLLVTGQRREALQALDDFLSNAQEGTASVCIGRRAALAEEAGDLRAARDYYCRASDDFTARVKALEGARRLGEQAPHYTRPTFDEDCKRLTDLLKGRPGARSP